MVQPDSNDSHSWTRKASEKSTQQRSRRRSRSPDKKSSHHSRQSPTNSRHRKHGHKSEHKGHRKDGSLSQSPIRHDSAENDRYRRRSRSPDKKSSHHRRQSPTNSRHRKHGHKLKHDRSHARNKHQRESSSNTDSSGGGSDSPSCESSEEKPVAKVPLGGADVQISKEERRRRKARMKALETPEEKRARRLAKKEAKEKKRRLEMGWDKDYLGYTNTDNPFGDANLLETFVWHQKLEKEGKADLPKHELQKMGLKSQEANKIELEKVKERRLQREQELLQRDEEMQMEQRAREADQYKEWEHQEEKFHLQQAKLRSKIRIQDGRAKPIDLLAKYISAEEDAEAVEMHEPYTYLTGLTINDLEDLLEDIKVYMELDDAANVDYWRDMTIVVEAELSNLRKLDPTAKEHVGDRREGINDAVRTDVVRIFKGKTYNQLEMLQQQILDKIRSGEEGIDIGYWESLLQQLKAHMARARLRDRHQELLRKKLFQLKQEQGVASGPLFPIIKTDESPRDEPDAGPGREASPDEMPAPSADDQPVAGDVSRSADAAAVSEAAVLSDAGEELDTGVAGEVEEGDVEDEATLQSYAECEAGGYEPTLLRETELDPGTVVADPFTDLERLQFKRHEVSEQGQVMSAEDAAFEREARKGMAGDEATFSVEVPLASTSYLWQDKYRPRKPRFFNRVHTGFEWNKYNQTHYDFDNPPPKIVQGYKFNIFYPDVIDKSSTPEYTLTPCSENKDFGILKFHAGPPYEDIGFKIVNREWEYSYKRGFRCQFANGIFQLWFHFKRYRYRR